MAVEQVAVQELPFVIEPLSPKRVQLWSRFAGRATTEADMWIARGVYYAFWFELRVQKTFQHVIEWSLYLRGQSDAGSFVGWLDLLADEHITLLNAYSEIARQIAACEVSYARWYKDIDERFLAVKGVLDAVRQYGVMLCSEWSLAVPEHLLQESTSPAADTTGEGGESL